MPEREQSRSSACKARKSTTPLGTRCGRREREADHAHRGAILGRARLRRWKAPGPQEAVTLRGVAAGSGPRPVRSRSWGSPPHGRSRRRQWVAPRPPRRGTSSACAFEAYAPDASQARKATRARGHVLRSVLGLVHVNRHSTLPAKADGGDAPRTVSRSGKPLEREEEPAPGSAKADDARLAARHRFLKRSRVMRKKRKTVEAVVPARIGELGSKCPYVVSVCRNR